MQAAQSDCGLIVNLIRKETVAAGTVPGIRCPDAKVEEVTTLGAQGDTFYAEAADKIGISIDDKSIGPLKSDGMFTFTGANVTEQDWKKIRLFHYLVAKGEKAESESMNQFKSLLTDTATVFLTGCYLFDERDQVKHHATFWVESSERISLANTVSSHSALWPEDNSYTTPLVNSSLVSPDVNGEFDGGFVAPYWNPKAAGIAMVPKAYNVSLASSNAYSEIRLSPLDSIKRIAREHEDLF